VTTPPPPLPGDSATRPGRWGRLSTNRAAGLILLATAISGGAGYAFILLAGTILGAEAYTPVGVFFSVLYFGVTALAGVQQEFARSAHPTTGGVVRPQRANPRTFALGSAGVVLLVIAATSPLWSSRVFPDTGWSFVAPLACGEAAYVVLAVVSGLLYGVARWRLIFALIVTDGLLRLALGAVVLVLHPSTALLAWSMAAPFAIVPMAFAGRIIRSLRRAVELDSTTRELAWNVTRTLTAGAATGLLVSGLPAVVSATSTHVDAAYVGSIMLVLSLARAPIVVLVMAFQSYLVTTLRHAGDVLRRVWIILSTLAAGSLSLAALAWVIGVDLLGRVFGNEFHMGRTMLAVIVLSGGVTAGLCVSGAATLSRGHHGRYVSGWLVTAVATLALLAVPMAIDTRLTLALLVAPGLGLAVHLAALRTTKADR